LSKSVPTKAIELANTKVANVTPHDNRTRPYLMLIPAQRYKVGKWAAEHGMTASINFTRGAAQLLLALFVKQLYNLRLTPLSDSPNFILPKAVWKTIHQISPRQSFPLYSMWSPKAYLLKGVFALHITEVQNWIYIM